MDTQQWLIWLDETNGLVWPFTLSPSGCNRRARGESGTLALVTKHPSSRAPDRLTRRRSAKFVLRFGVPFSHLEML
ncbi:MAG: hypothetical protein H6965_09530 [Chromatiaceae bacterium]|nr:hypothetical protein [Chromatiaceae bacterium]